MVTLGGLHPKVLAIGGSEDGRQKLASIEEWQEAEEKWETSPMNLSAGRMFTTAIAIPPAALICPKN